MRPHDRCAACPELDAVPVGAPGRGIRARRHAAEVIVLVVLALAVAVPADLSAQGLSATEERIVAWIDDHGAEAIELLERTVEINSGTMNHAGVRQVADVMAVELQALGFETRWVELPTELERAGHLVAERTGSRGQRLLLIGHLDTVFEEDSPFQEFERRDSVAHGPGAADMKGGNVVIVQALRALDAAGALDGATIRIVLTGDEESPGRPLDVTRGALIEAARQSDVALGFESGSRDSEHEYAVVARRSSSRWKLTVAGTPSHSSRVFSESVGAGAIFEAARILSAFYDEVRGEEYLTFNPGVILGGTELTYDPEANRGRAFGKTNVVAEHAVVHGGIRTISGEQLERARAAMRRVVMASLPGASAEIEFEDAYPAMPPTDGNRALLSAYDRASRDLGYGPVLPFDPGGRGAADISFVASYVAGLDGLGPYGRGAHTVDETLDLRSVPKATKRAALLIYRLITGAVDVP
jgi:glutamate carboxypeptidase